jgi:hypothetical protein
MRPNSEQAARLNEYSKAVQEAFGWFGTWDFEVNNTDIIVTVSVKLNGGATVSHRQPWLDLLSEKAGMRRCGELVGAKLRRDLSVALKAAREDDPKDSSLDLEDILSE